MTTEYSIKLVIRWKAPGKPVSVNVASLQHNGIAFKTPTTATTPDGIVVSYSVDTTAPHDVLMLLEFLGHELEEFKYEMHADGKKLKTQKTPPTKSKHHLVVQARWQ